ncbi:hypothetical protein ACFX1T_003162 [Malus domestica]
MLNATVEHDGLEASIVQMIESATEDVAEVEKSSWTEAMWVKNQIPTKAQESTLIEEQSLLTPDAKWSDRGKDEVVEEEAEADLDVHTEKHWFLDSNKTPVHHNHPSHFATVLEVWDRQRQTTDPRWISGSGTN